VFSLSDGAILNATYILPTNGIILGRLDNLQAGKAFFESVNNNNELLTAFCGTVRRLSQQTDEFLGTLTSSEFAPVRTCFPPNYWLAGLMVILTLTVRGLFRVLVRRSKQRRLPVSYLAAGGRIQLWWLVNVKKDGSSLNALDEGSISYWLIVYCTRTFLLDNLRII
jgi:hypothetical protein